MTFFRRDRSKAACRFMTMWRDKRGISAVEFALVATLLLFFFMAATDLALAIFTAAEVGNAARAGTEYAAINGYNKSGIDTAVQNTTGTWLKVTDTSTNYCGCATSTGVTQQTCGPPCSACTACSGGGTPGTYVSVTATGKYSPIFPTAWNQWLVSGFLNMSVTETTRTN